MGAGAYLSPDRANIGYFLSTNGLAAWFDFGKFFGRGGSSFYETEKDFERENGEDVGVQDRFKG